MRTPARNKATKDKYAGYDFKGLVLHNYLITIHKQQILTRPTFINIAMEQYQFIDKCEDDVANNVSNQSLT
jgi:hypothetical protein